MAFSLRPFRQSMFEKRVSEKDIKRLKNIQMGALLPVCLFLIFFLFTKKALFLLFFFVLLILGVLMPWTHREILSSHLVLSKRIDELAKKPADPSAQDHP